MCQMLNGSLHLGFQDPLGGPDDFRRGVLPTGPPHDRAEDLVDGLVVLGVIRDDARVLGDDLLDQGLQVRGPGGGCLGVLAGQAALDLHPALGVGDLSGGEPPDGCNDIRKEVRNL